MPGGELAPDGFVGASANFGRTREREGKVDETVIEEGGAVFERVGHGVFVLPDEGPVGEPVLVLLGE